MLGYVKAGRCRSQSLLGPPCDVFEKSDIANGSLLIFGYFWVIKQAGKRCPIAADKEAADKEAAFNDKNPWKFLMSSCCDLDLSCLSTVSCRASGHAMFFVIEFAGGFPAVDTGGYPGFGVGFAVFSAGHLRRHADC